MNNGNLKIAYRGDEVGRLRRTVIPDEYEYMDEELVQMLNDMVLPYL